MQRSYFVASPCAVLAIFTMANNTIREIGSKPGKTSTNKYVIASKGLKSVYKVQKNKYT